MDVFVMIRRQKLTLFLDGKESTTVHELKKMIEGITKVPTQNQRLIFDATALDDENQTLSEYGISGSELSTPPPLPEVFSKVDEDKKDNANVAS
ncbi:unnamed protein product [Didymodactylos carnosus]|uniref:Ubiquitin-like domain-containing protein n=2 Tax=Didymodactylos carnosus TaxID=1234261 RepID=A0A8S2IK11_9BILA|nr:unnamed protein product [Didymodactylos carnosus]CAF3737464.1 unnamed protein product [Didymodactylos carnosus]